MSTQDETTPRTTTRLRKASLDKDLSKIGHVEDVTRLISLRFLPLGVAIVFITLCAMLAGIEIGQQPNAWLLVCAAVLGGYMSLNIGANDVANNVGPAVGSRALTMTGALVIAAIFECAGALIAGGDVVQTISKGIVEPSAVASSQMFVAVMLSALIASAVWVNLATWIGAPVSTTHAVVGGVVGAGIAAVGLGAVNWVVMSAIAASWVISPLLGGVIAAAVLAFIKANIIYREDKIEAARRWVPVLIAVMCAAFAAYLMMKGLKRIWPVSNTTIALLSCGVFAGSLVALRPIIHRQSIGLENRNRSLRKLFHIPLICSAALLSFAHGANDVANAVGPLAGILHSVQTGGVSGKVELPFWVMLIGGVGISVGLFLFGPRLIRVVGGEITKMNPMRAFCVALSAAVTVIIATALGLPVSSTHIAVGAVFGVGFFREYYTTHSKRRRDYIAAQGKQPAGSEDWGGDRDWDDDTPELIRRKLVRRSHFTVVIAAWLITVPAAAFLAGLCYLGIALAWSGL